MAREVVHSSIFLVDNAHRLQRSHYNLSNHYYFRRTSRYVHCRRKLVGLVRYQWYRNGVAIVGRDDRNVPGGKHGYGGQWS